MFFLCKRYAWNFQLYEDLRYWPSWFVCFFLSQDFSFKLLISFFRSTFSSCIFLWSFVTCYSLSSHFRLSKSWIVLISCTTFFNSLNSLFFCLNSFWLVSISCTVFLSSFSSCLCCSLNSSKCLQFLFWRYLN